MSEPAPATRPIRLFVSPHNVQCFPVTLLCLNFGLPFERVDTNSLMSGLTKESYPLLEDNGFTLRGCPSILRYLASLHVPHLYPSDLRKRALIDQHFEALQTLHMHLHTVAFFRTISPLPLGSFTDAGANVLALYHVEQLLRSLEALEAVLIPRAAEAVFLSSSSAPAPSDDSACSAISLSSAISPPPLPPPSSSPPPGSREPSSIPETTLGRNAVTQSSQAVPKGKCRTTPFFLVQDSLSVADLFGACVMLPLNLVKDLVDLSRFPHLVSWVDHVARECGDYFFNVTQEYGTLSLPSAPLDPPTTGRGGAPAPITACASPPSVTSPSSPPSFISPLSRVPSDLAAPSGTGVPAALGAGNTVEAAALRDSVLFGRHPLVCAVATPAVAALISPAQQLVLEQRHMHLQPSPVPDSYARTAGEAVAYDDDDDDDGAEMSPPGRERAGSDQHWHALPPNHRRSNSVDIGGVGSPRLSQRSETKVLSARSPYEAVATAAQQTLLRRADNRFCLSVHPELAIQSEMVCRWHADGAYVVVESVVNGPVDEVMAFVSNVPESINRLDPDCKSARRLSDITRHLMTNYIAMDVLEQSDARTRTARFDFVTLSSLRKLVDGTCLVSVTSLDDYQQKKGYVRCRLKDSGWILSPISRAKTQVILVLQILFPARVPSWVLENMRAKGPLFMNGLRKHFNKPSAPTSLHVHTFADAMKDSGPAVM